MEPSIPFVILMGVGVVFIGLICIILLCMAMSAICRDQGDKTPAPAPVSGASAAPPARTDAIPKRQGSGERRVGEEGRYRWAQYH